MKATKDHISLQTAKLLKGKLKNQEISYFFKSIKGDEYILVKCDGGEYRYEELYDYPAYTWQEIKDNAKKFFCAGEEMSISVEEWAEYNILNSKID